jgi:intracellular proteinase inhibitor BsuPI
MQRTRIFLLAGLVALGLQCGQDGNPPPAYDERNVTPANGLSVALSTDRPQYTPRQAIAARLVLTNGGAQDATLEFRDGQRYDFAVTDGAGRILWRWSADKGFIDVIGVEVVPPQGELAYTESVPAPPEPGRYRLVGTITAFGVALADTIEITVVR